MNAAEDVIGPTRAAGRGSAPALRWRDEVVTYDALAALACRAGNALRRLGVGPDDRVAMLLCDSPELVACYLGAMKIGAVAIALNVRLSAADLAHVLSDSGAKALLADRQFRPLYDAAAGRLRAAPALVEADVAGMGPSPLARAIAAEPAALEPVERAPDDMAFWIYTSGTTGTAKGAVHCHGDVAVADRYAGETLGVGPGDVLFATSKLFFAYALGTCVFGALRLGATTVLHDAWPDPQAVAAIVARHRPTVVFSVPAMYRNMLADGVAGGAGFDTVRHYVSAGERLPAGLWRRWREATGVEILDGMGTSETIYMLLTNNAGAVKPGASGKAAPGVEVRLADADGNDAAPGQTGILWARIASRCAGYWGCPEASAEAFRGEWFRTGDMYAVDDEGYWHHQGRHDDMLKISGQWVSPAEIEEVVLADTPVRDAVVVAAGDADGLARTTLFAVPPEGPLDAQALEAEIRAAIVARLSPYKCPKRIRFIEAIPRTATGKAQRYKLRTEYDREPA